MPSKHLLRRRKRPWWTWKNDLQTGGAGRESQKITKKVHVGRGPEAKWEISVNTDMKIPRQHLWMVLVLAPLSVPGALPSIPALHLINDSGVDIYTALSTNNVFVTDYKGKNDVKVTLLAGSLAADYIDTFGGADGFGNPSYITNFLGAATNGTGNGVVGSIEDIQTYDGLSVQFDFALRLTPEDRLFIIDCDNTEEYQVQVFIKNGASFAAESLVNWSVTNFAGSTKELPTTGFPIWNGSTGVLTSGGSSLDEPLTVFRPDQPVDRVIIGQIADSGGTASLQFVTAGPPSLTITLIGPDSVVVSWPDAGSYTLQQNSTLAAAGWATSGYTVSTVNNTNSITVNPASGNLYFRLSTP